MLSGFFFAGFECATGYNVHREWIDQIAATGHDVRMHADYQALRQVGLLAARDGVRWPIVDRGDRFDLSSVVTLIDASQRAGVQVIHDLFHFGYPDGLDPLGPDFAPRFAEYCHVVARCLRRYGEPPFWLSPINEPSYFAWAGGEVGRFAPHQNGRGWDLKVALARAAIAGTNALWDELPQARIVSVDALCRVVPPLGDGHDLLSAVADFNDRIVFQCWDLISGRLCPELGGSPRHLGILGVNYYWTNQWEIGRDNAPLVEDDPRLLPLHVLLAQAWQRYGAELLMTETSHVGARRASWVMHIAEQARLAIGAGVPLHGICLYPILGMPEWHARDVWVPMGLWDIEPETGARHLYRPMLEALDLVRHRIRPLPGIEAAARRG